ncbi:MAG TPA: glycosyltransferase family 39 protein [Candidatus Brocadiia bacterium]|nr:glycosyltransferase family 39 protein [Candidatus Brocadiales bacterium]
MKSIPLLKEQKYYTTILLCLIIFLAAFLRIYYLSTPSYSSDDVLAIKKINEISAKYIVWEALHKSRPMLFFISVHCWQLLAGSSEFALRLPSAIFGILSVFVIFKLASLIFDKKTALIGALLLAVNPEHFFFSCSLKAYTLTTLLALTSLYLLLRALKGHRTILWIAFCISNVMLLYTHNSAVFIVLTELFFMAVVFYRKRKYPWLIYSAMGIIFTLLAVLFFAQKVHTEAFSKPEFIEPPTIGTFLNVLSSFVAGFYIMMPKRGIIFADAIRFDNQGAYIEALSLPVRISILTFFCILLLFGIYKYFWRQTTSDEPQPLIKSGASDRYKPLIYGWGAIPILAAYASSFLFWPTFGPTRYHLFWSCLILLLIAKGISSTPDLIRGKLRFICPIILIVICIHLFPIITAESNPRRLDWKGVANYIEETASDGETVHFLFKEFASKPIKYYYKKDIYIGLNEVFKKITPNIGGNWSKGVFLIEVIEIGKSDLPPELIDFLGTLYYNKDVKQFHHIRVTHYWKPKFTLP